MNRSRSAIPKQEEKRAVVRSMFDTIAPQYDLLNRLLCLRMDVGWRRKTIRLLRLKPQSAVFDLACGTGDFCRELEDAGHQPVGIDFSKGMLTNARCSAPLVQGDLLALPSGDSTFDAAVCGFALRNLVSIPPFLDELFRTVVSGGRIGLLEVSQPENRLLAWGHGVYFNRVVPFLGGLLSDRTAYSYLPQSVEYLPDPPELKMMLQKAGFVEIRRNQLFGGVAQVYTATRP